MNKRINKKYNKLSIYEMDKRLYHSLRQSFDFSYITDNYREQYARQLINLLNSNEELVNQLDVEELTDKLEEVNIGLRQCSKCKRFMVEGYWDGDNWYHSNKCLNKDYTEEEWIQEYKTNDQAGYTEWY